MILPDAPCKSWKVEIGMSSCADTGNIDAQVVVVDDSDMSSPDAVAGDAEKSQNAVEAPNCYSSVDPGLVPPLVLVAVEDVIVATYNGENREGNMYQ